jgi:hypothetical protein
MRIDIQIRVNLTQEQEEAFVLCTQKELTEKNVSEFILANGINGLDFYVNRIKEAEAYAGELPF